MDGRKGCWGQKRFTASNENRLDELWICLTQKVRSLGVRVGSGYPYAESPTP